MAKKKDSNEVKKTVATEVKKPVEKVEKAAPKKISKSTKAVKFKASKDSGKLKKDRIYTVSENVADLLESKKLGKKL